MNSSPVRPGMGQRVLGRPFFLWHFSPPTVYDMVAKDSSSVTIVGFSPSLARDFYRLNCEWLQRYFTLEPIDEQILGNPMKYIVKPGGDILFARQESRIVGTCALMPENAATGHFELTKMGVTAEAQGQGIGRRLIEAALARYQDLKGNLLFLETNSRLHPAIRLYESVGFRSTPHPHGASLYQRADVYMIYDPPVASL